MITVAPNVNQKLSRGKTHVNVAIESGNKKISWDFVCSETKAISLSIYLQVSSLHHDSLSKAV